MIRKLTVVLLTGVFCLLGVTSALAVTYVTLEEYEKLTGKTIEEFNEAPMLRTRVAAGELPPVEERLPEDPFVVVPIDRIGIYGCTAQLASRFTTAPVGSLFGVGWGHYVRSNLEVNKVELNFATQIEISEDQTVFTIHLRRGVKFSDGVPFTADDPMFWYTDVLHNKELTPVIDPYWKGVEMKKLDDYTIQIKTPGSRPYFLEYPISKGRPGGSYNIPKHYLKQFHPKYTAEEELKKKVKEAGFDYWYELFLKKNTRYHQLPVDTECPTLASYVPVTITSSRRVFERNPYYWKIDTAGNQLPYIDRLVVDVITDMEVINGKLISGELDYKAFNLSLKDYPMFKRYEKEGGYRVLSWTTVYGSQIYIMFNQTHKDPVLRKIFQDARFRRAMSIAINREEINETKYFGKAKIKQYTVVETSKSFNPEFAEAYIEYNPEEAERLLQEVGLKKGTQGWYLRPDGKKLTFTLISKHPQVFGETELVVSQWRDIGIDAEAKLISGELYTVRLDGNLIDVGVWYGGAGTTDMTFPVFHANVSYGSVGKPSWPKWSDEWFGTAEVEKEYLPIPEEVKKLREWYLEVISTADAAKRAELCEKLLRSQAENLWIIGTVSGAPHPVIFDEDLRNYHEHRFWVWDLTWASSPDPEQLFFDEDADERR